METPTNGTTRSLKTEQILGNCHKDSNPDAWFPACAHPAIKKVWDHGAATRNVRERNAHRRWIKKSRPRWTARADAWSAKQVERAAVERSGGRCITVA